MEDDDYDCTYRPNLENPQTCPRKQQCSYRLVRKLVQLMDDPMSSNQTERHLTLLHEFLNTSKHGFWVRELPFVLRLIELLVERLQEIPEFRNPLEYLLATCATPPMMVRSSELFHCTRDVQELFNLLGYLLFSSKDEEIWNLSTHAITCLLERKCPVGICSVPLDLIYKAVELSELPAILASLLEFIEKNYYEKLLDLTLVVAEVSSEACSKMISERILDFIIPRMLPFWDILDLKQLQELIVDNNIEKILYIDTTCSIIWALLKAYQKADISVNDSYTGPSQYTLWNLRYIFRILVKQRTYKTDRNNILAIILYFMSVFPKINIRSSGLHDDICLLCGASELGTGGTWASEVRLSVDHHDYEFKKMLLIGIYYCIRLGVVSALKQRKVVTALLRLIIPEMTMNWDMHHYCKLNSMALDLLCEVVTVTPENFTESNGCERILSLLRVNSPGDYNTGLFRDVLKFLHNLLALNNQIIIEKFQNLGAVNMLVSIGNNILEKENFTNLTQYCLQYAFSALEILVKKVETFNTTAVQLCINYMQRHMRPKDKDIVQSPSALICVISFLWELLLLCDENLYYFIQKGGIYLTLDIIESNIYPVKVVALGLIVDACEEGRCITHLVTWRRNKIKFIPLLMEIFREENRKLGVKTSSKYIINDIENPLMGKKQFTATYSKLKDPNSSPSLMDLLGSCRPKVYAILQLFERHKERVDIANEQYKILELKPSVDDEITMLLAENFLPLKLGEVWNELFIDFRNMQLQPLGIDRKIIDTLSRRIRKWSLHIKTVQEHLLLKEKHVQFKIEKKYYHFLKESKLVESLDALHELNYIARTTESMFRLMKKMKQRMYLDACDTYSNTLAEYHPTFMNIINVTHVYNQKVKVESNKIIDPFAKPFDLKLVSPHDEIVQTTEPECNNRQSKESII